MFSRAIDALRLSLSTLAHFVTAPDVYASVEGEYPNYPIRIPIECE